MASCCSNFFGENDITRNQLIRQAKIAALENKVDPNKLVSKKKILTDEDKKLKNVFSRLVTHIWDKELLKDHKILMLANKHGEILKCVTSYQLPSFFIKQEDEVFDWTIEAFGANAIGFIAKTCKSASVNMKEHYFEPLHSMQTNAVPVCNGNNEMIAILGFTDHGESVGKAIGCLQGLLVAFELALNEQERVELLERDGQKRETFFMLTHT